MVFINTVSQRTQRPSIVRTVDYMLYILGICLMLNTLNDRISKFKVNSVCESVPTKVSQLARRFDSLITPEGLGVVKSYAHVYQEIIHTHELTHVFVLNIINTISYSTYIFYFLLETTSSAFTFKNIQWKSQSNKLS